MLTYSGSLDLSAKGVSCLIALLLPPCSFIKKIKYMITYSN